jgi:hypothetical protein
LNADGKLLGVINN